MNRIFAMFLALTLGTQAAALSCVRPDPAAAFQFAAGSTETYVILRGSLDFNAALMPSGGGDQRPETLPAIPAVFAGTALAPQGFTIPYRTELFLQPSCTGPWCGGMAPASDVVALARDNGAGVYVIDLGPCGGTVFEATAETVATFTTCMAGGACRPAR